LGLEPWIITMFKAFIILIQIIYQPHLSSGQNSQINLEAHEFKFGTW
jgi:hypothetical protein